MYLLLWLLIFRAHDFMSTSRLIVSFGQSILGVGGCGLQQANVLQWWPDLTNL